jgi:hypothetical protein
MSEESEERPEDNECFHCALLALFYRWVDKMNEKDLLDEESGIHVMLSLARVMGICHGESIRHIGAEARETVEREALAMYHSSVAEREAECLSDEGADEDGSYALH